MKFDFIRMSYVRSVRFLILSLLALVATGVGNVHAAYNMTLVDSGSNSLTCQVNDIVQDAQGILTVDQPDCLASIDGSGSSLRFLNGGNVANTGCVFSNLEMTANGDITVHASDACVVVQSLAFTLKDNRFELDCEADSSQQDGYGLLTLDNVSCLSDIRTVAQTSAPGVIQFNRANFTSRSCQFGSMSMDANGFMVITAVGDCFGDTDGDGIPNPIDPNPSQGAVVGAECLPQPDAVGGKESSILLGDGVNAETANVTCYLPNAPERVIAANSVLGATNSPISVDFYAKDQVVLFEGTALRGNSSMSIQSDVQTQPVVRIWGPFTVEAGSVLKIHPAPTLN